MEALVGPHASWDRRRPSLPGPHHKLRDPALPAVFALAPRPGPRLHHRSLLHPAAPGGAGHRLRLALPVGAHRAGGPGTHRGLPGPDGGQPRRGREHARAHRADPGNRPAPGRGAAGAVHAVPLARLRGGREYVLAGNRRCRAGASGPGRHFKGPAERAGRAGGGGRGGQDFSLVRALSGGDLARGGRAAGRRVPGPPLRPLIQAAPRLPAPGHPGARGRRRAGPPQPVMIRRRLLPYVVVAALALPVVAQAATWGWLGVRIRDLSEQEMEEISTRHGIREGYGALIVEVLKETPAARAGLQNGDLVVAFKDRPVVDTRSLQRFVAATPAGQEVPLTVLRGGEGRRTVRVSVGVMPQEVVAERVAAEFGFVVRDPQGERESLRPSGVPAIAVVLRDSQADRAGLKPP